MSHILKVNTSNTGFRKAYKLNLHQDFCDVPFKALRDSFMGEAVGLGVIYGFSVSTEGLVDTYELCPPVSLKKFPETYLFLGPLLFLLKDGVLDPRHWETEPSVMELIDDKGKSHTIYKATRVESNSESLVVYMNEEAYASVIKLNK